jgi:AcrR family transcriptional regulator
VSSVNIDGSTTPSARTGYHHGDARNAFLRAALGLVEARGVDGFSLREAARVVGVSPSAAYRHFADKQALLTALAEEGDARMTAAMRGGGAEARAGRDGVEAVIAELWAYARAIVEFALATPAYLRVMSACKRSADEGGSRMAGPALLALQGFDELIAMGAMRAEDRDRALLAGWAGVFGLAWMTLEGTSLGDSPEFREASLDAVLRTMFLGLGIDAAALPDPPAQSGLGAD